MRILINGLKAAARWIVLSAVLQGIAGAQNPAERGQSFASRQTSVSSGPMFEGKIGADRTGRLLWVASIAALTAANVADARSSWRKDEGNGVLAGTGGTFGAKGAGIKCGVNALWIAGQVIALRRNRSHRTFAIVNFAGAGVLGAVAYRNNGMR